MYQYLKGTLTEKSPTSVAVEVAGVGYLVQIPLSTFSALPGLGQPVRLLTHLVVREDAHLLYGFVTEEERQLFRLLLGVSGIGPRMAMNVLAGGSLTEIKQAIIEGSLVFLTRISGIGKKTAERIVVELREKLILEERPAVALSAKLGIQESVLEDSVQALVELGYRKQNAREAIEKALKNFDSEKISVSDLIRASLKHVG